jgi:hypothetical protein
MNETGVPMATGQAKRPTCPHALRSAWHSEKKTTPKRGFKAAKKLPSLVQMEESSAAVAVQGGLHPPFSFYPGQDSK